MQIIETRENDIITIAIEDRVDTNTSPQLQKAILKGFQEVNHVVLNFANCTYVSSAGLRVLLIGEKTSKIKNGSMKLVQVPELIMNVLQMSGFANILTIE